MRNPQESVLVMIDELAKHAHEMQSIKIMLITDPTVDIASLSAQWQHAIANGLDTTILMQGIPHVVIDGINGIAVVANDKIQIDGNRVTLG